MSKRRFTMPSNPQKRVKSYTNSMLLTDPDQHKAYQRKSLESRLLNRLKCKTQINNHGQEQSDKDKLFHKCFTQFKQIFQSKSNTHNLPYIISLRSAKKREKSLPSSTISQPFEASNKETINQKIKKKISDINANPKRILGAAYRLRSSNGVSTRISCDFQCGLREENLAKSTGEVEFIGYIRPGKFKLIQERKFKMNQLVCHRQEKLFNLFQEK